MHLLHMDSPAIITDVLSKPTLKHNFFFIVLLFDFFFMEHQSEFIYSCFHFWGAQNNVCFSLPHAIIHQSS